MDLVHVVHVHQSSSLTRSEKCRIIYKHTPSVVCGASKVVQFGCSGQEGGREVTHAARALIQFSYKAREVHYHLRTYAFCRPQSVQQGAFRVVRVRHAIRPRMAWESVSLTYFSRADTTNAQPIYAKNTAQLPRKIRQNYDRCICRSFDGFSAYFCRGM